MIAIKKPSMDSMFGTVYEIEGHKLLEKRTNGLTIDQILTQNFKTYEEYINRFVFGSAENEIPTKFKINRLSGTEVNKNQ